MLNVQKLMCRNGIANSAVDKFHVTSSRAVKNWAFAILTIHLVMELKGFYLFSCGVSRVINWLTSNFIYKFDYVFFFVPKCQQNRILMMLMYDSCGTQGIHLNNFDIFFPEIKFRFNERVWRRIDKDTSFRGNK